MKLEKIIAGGLALFIGMSSQKAIQPVMAAELELKMQFASPDGPPWNKMDKRFAKKLENMLGGRAEVLFFPSNSVVPFKDWLQATGAGLLDIGFVWHPIWADKFPQMEHMSLPGLTQFGLR